MTTIEARHTPPAKRTKPATSAKGAKATIKKRSSANTAPTKTELGIEHAAWVTKHDRMLTLLSRRDWATIPEMMEATGWQQHSVRGFLAGTVKKTLGFPLTSLKAEGDVRRYRIATRRGR